MILVSLIAVMSKKVFSATEEMKKVIKIFIKRTLHSYGIGIAIYFC